MTREILDLIKDYIPLHYQLLLNKSLYLKHHFVLRRLILPSNYEKYVRETVCRDHSFVFENVLRENSERWLQMKDYFYRGRIFSNYIYFLRAFCTENDSLNCYKTINSILTELGLGKNLHKKNISRSIIYYH